MTLEEIVNSLKSAGQDYGQLFNNNPKYTAVASNVTKGLENLVPPQFTNTQDAKSQEYSKKLAEWALGNGMGMSGMALTFIGKNAANWNPVKAAEAEKLLNAGVDPVQVWKEHLIGRMPDKSLFSEISDEPLTVRVDDFSNPYGSWGIDPQKVHGLNDIQSLLDEGISERGVHSLTGWAKHYGESLPPEGQWNPPPQSYYKEKLIEHQPLSKLYDFHNLQTKGAASESPMANGYFNSENNKIVINALTDKKQNLKNYSGARSVAAHELQHAIQDREGWARGGSPDDFSAVNSTALIKESNDLYKLLNSDYAKELEAAQATGDFKNIIKIRNKNIDEYNKIGDVFHRFKTTNLEEARNKALDLGNTLTPREQYLRLTGEAQARATQDRMNMNMQQRRDTYPLAGGKLSDIPLDQLINRYYK